MTFDLDWKQIIDREGFDFMWEPVDSDDVSHFFRSRFTDRGDQLYGMKPITQSIALVMLNIGIHTLTNRNLDEFFIRAQMFYDASGDPLIAVDKETQKREGYRWTYDDLRRHIGLSSNASTLTAERFQRQLGNLWRQKALNELRIQRARWESHIKTLQDKLESEVDADGS